MKTPYNPALGVLDAPHDVIINYGGLPPEVATVANAHKIYIELGGVLSQRSFAEKAKTWGGCSLGNSHREGDVSVTFTARQKTKEVHADFKGITSFVDVETD